MHILHMVCMSMPGCHGAALYGYVKRIYLPLGISLLCMCACRPADVSLGTWDQADLGVTPSMCLSDRWNMAHFLITVLREHQWPFNFLLPLLCESQTRWGAIGWGTFGHTFSTRWPFLCAWEHATHLHYIKDAQNLARRDVPTGPWSVTCLQCICGPLKNGPWPIYGMKILHQGAAWIAVHSTHSHSPILWV